MKDSVVAQTLENTKEADMNDMEKPHSGYSGMHWAHLRLTSQMIWAINSSLQEAKWPDHVEPERAKALRMIGETISVFEKFYEEYCPPEDGELVNADDQKRWEQAQAWSNEIFYSLPALPSVE